MTAPKAVLCGRISPTLQPEAVSSSNTTNHGPRFCSKASAFLNMLLIVVTDETFQPEMSPLKEEARSNIQPMLVTMDVSHVERPSPVKLGANWNIPCMFLTFEVSQPERSPVKFVALRNISCMFLTFEVSQPERSPPVKLAAL